MDQIKRLIALFNLWLQRARARSGVIDIVVRTFKRFSEDDGGSYAAALTYYTFFSLFPLLLFGAAILGYVTFDNDALQKELIQSGVNSVPILKDAITEETLSAISERKDNLAITGAVLALYTGTGVIVALQHALNKIDHTPQEPNFLQKRIRSLGWLVVLGLASVVSLALSTVTGFAPGLLAVVLALIGGFLLNTGIFATAYRYLPATRRGWKEVLPGSLVAAVAFEVLKVAGTTYLARGESARMASFGAFAAAAALLIASYLISQVILLSAEVNLVLAERRQTRATSTTEER